MFAYISSYFTSIWNSIFGPLLMLTSSLQQHHPNKSGRLLVLGLDNAGKTTLLQAIRRLDTTTTNNNIDTTTSNNNNNNINLRSYPPTDRPEHIKNIVTINNQITFHAYDLGGHEAVRHLWSDYYYYDNSSNNSNNMNINTTSSSSGNHNLAILFCIDIADRQRIDEAAYELDALIHDGLNSANNNNVDDNNNNNNNSHDQNYNHHDYRDSTILKTGIPIAILLTKCDDMHENINNNNNNNNNNNTSLPLIMTLSEVCELIDYTSLQNSHNGPMHICTVSVYKNSGYVEALQWITKTLVRQQQQQQQQS